MAIPSFAPESSSQRRITLAEIDELVAARLGATRGLGNSQPACFNRQVAMYLAARVGRWSTTVIGRFYNGRDHSTVCHGIQRIESLRDSDPDVDALLSNLMRRLGVRALGDATDHPPAITGELVETEKLKLSSAELEEIANILATRLREMLMKTREQPQLGSRKLDSTGS